MDSMSKGYTRNKFRNVSLRQPTFLLNCLNNISGIRSLDGIEAEE